MKNIALLAAGLISLFSVSSCYKEEVSSAGKSSEARRVDFRVERTENFEIVDDVRTGVYLKPIYTWQDTKVENVSLYEVEYNGATIIREGEDITITTEEPYSQAIFSAGFYQSIDADTQENAPMTRGAGDQGTYSYDAIIARNKDGKFFIPAEQYPAEATWIDPDCDFLVGKVDGVTARMSRNVIDGLVFVRPAAFSRLAITNLDAKTIYKIVITSENALTGSAAFTDINFRDDNGKELAIENVTVNFTGDSNTLTMIWPEGLAVKGTTYANFVSILGEKIITKVDIYTDEYIYTKTIGKKQTFRANQFTNIALNMFYTEGGEIQRTELPSQKVKFQQGGEDMEADELTYVIGSDAFVSPVLVGAAEGAAVTYASDNEDVATVDATTGAVTIVGVKGKAKITATASAVGDYPKASLSYTLTVEEPAAKADRELAFASELIEKTAICSPVTNTLTGLKTDDVEFTSSNPAVGIVNSAGQVTIQGSGTTIITASAGETEDYKAGQAQYTLVILLAARQLYFSNPYVSVDLGETVPANELHGTSEGNITYESDNTDVATVDASTGKVTLVGAGTATIKVSITESAKYASESTSYQLFVIDPDVKTYTKVTEISEGKKYVIADGTNALQNKEGSVDAFSISSKVADGKLTLTAEEAASLEWTASTTESDKGNFVFANGGIYASRKQTENIIEFLDNAGDRAAFTLDGSQLYNLNSSNDKYFLNYSSKWQATTGGGSAVITIYEECAAFVIPPETTYTKVATNSGSLEAGSYLIVNPASNRALSGALAGGDNEINDIKVAPADGVISGYYSAIEMTIEVSGSNYTIKNASGKYLYSNPGNISTSLGYQTSSNNFTLETSTNYADRFYFRTSKSGSDAEYLHYYGTNYFTIGDSGKPVNTDEAQQAAAGVYLYKKN